MVEKKRDKFIDIVKAIGIISIVIGHSSAEITRFKLRIGPFVYTYHLMVFMFVAGFLFNKKNIVTKDDKYKYISKEIFKMLKLFFIYNLCFVLLHNILLKIGIIGGDGYHFSNMIQHIFNGLTFTYSEILLGAFWFIPMFLIAKILFVLSFNEEKYKCFIIPIIFALTGLVLCYKNITLNYYLHISIISVPFIYIGYYSKLYWEKIKKYVFSFGWIVCIGIISLVLILTNSNIDLAANKIINPFIFYPISFVGIYFCLSLAKFIDKIKCINNLFSIAGRYSFQIMGLHFLFIKIVDLIYCNIINDRSLLVVFPCSHSQELWPFYYTIGVIGPIITIFLFNKIKSKFFKKI